MLHLTQWFLDGTTRVLSAFLLFFNASMIFTKAIDPGDHSLLEHPSGTVIDKVGERDQLLGQLSIWIRLATKKRSLSIVQLDNIGRWFLAKRIGHYRSVDKRKGFCQRLPDSGSESRVFMISSKSREKRFCGSSSFTWSEADK